MALGLQTLELKIKITKDSIFLCKAWGYSLFTIATGHKLIRVLRALAVKKAIFMKKFVAQVVEPCVCHFYVGFTDLIGQYTSAFNNDPSTLTDSLGEIDASSGDFAAIQRQVQDMFGDPTEMLMSMRSDRQLGLLPEIATLMAPIVGYVDHIMDGIGSTLIPSYSQITEALRRRRVTASESDRFVERLLGLELDQDVGGVDGLRGVRVLEVQDALVHVARAGGVDADRLVGAAGTHEPAGDVQVVDR